MAKTLTMPTAPEAPVAPQISIGDRIHGIENRIEEIESISGMNNSRSNSQNNHQTEQEEPEENQEEQEEEQTQTHQQTQSTPKTQQRQPPQTVRTPEAMARDAVANGSGALTKRTTTRTNDDEDSRADDGGSHSRNQSTVVIPPTSSALNDNGQTNFERGRAVLNEFKQLDQEEGKIPQNTADTTSSTTTPGIFAPSYGSNSSGHGAAYWLFTVVAVVIMAYFFIRQFLVNKNSKSDIPPLTKSTLDIPDINAPLSSTIPKESAVNQYKQSNSLKSKPIQNTIAKPIVKPVTKPVKPLKLEPKKNEDESRGKHFEVRV